MSNCSYAKIHRAEALGRVQALIDCFTALEEVVAGDVARANQNTPAEMVEIDPEVRATADKLLAAFQNQGQWIYRGGTNEGEVNNIYGIMEYNCCLCQLFPGQERLCNQAKAFGTSDDEEQATTVDDWLSELGTNGLVDYNWYTVNSFLKAVCCARDHYKVVEAYLEKRH